MVWYGLSEQRQALCVQNNGINHKGNESPCFLRVPAPVCAPAYVSPYCTDEDAQSHRSYGRVEKYTAKHLQALCLYVCVRRACMVHVTNTVNANDHKGREAAYKR